MFSKLAPKDSPGPEMAQGTNEPTRNLDLSSVLPVSKLPWWKTPHLVKLNLLLTVPMMTGYLIGFDSSMLNGLQSVPVWISGQLHLSWPCCVPDTNIQDLRL